jgi:F-box and leucine-rich repeat protein 2/20
METGEPEGAPLARRLRSGVIRRDVVPKRRTRAIAALDLLQDDLLVEIFTHLDQFPDLLVVRQVCKQWYNLSRDARLWRTLSFEGHENVTSRDLDSLCEKTPALRRLKSLSLAKIHNITVEDVRQIPRTECAATLEQVDLSWCSGANDKSVVEYSRCPGLRELRLSHCRLVTRRSVRILAVRCPRLEVLDLNCIGGIRDSLLEVIGQNCPRLRVLNIANARNITDDGVAALAKGCSRLEVLDMSWCLRVTDLSISKVSSNMRCLREVGLSETRVTNRGIADLARNCSELEALHLARCLQISNEGAESIVKYCHKRLTTLNIASCHNITDEFVERLIRVCPRLVCLDVSKLPCRAISEMLERVAAVRNVQVYF